MPNKIEIDEEKMINLFNSGKSHREIAQSLGVNKGVITYRLKQKGYGCGRFKSYKSCQLCGRDHTGVYAKYCNTCVSKIRRLGAKIKAIKYKGSTCRRCGRVSDGTDWAGYEFHHPDGEKKEHEIGKILNRKWETIQKEIEKCDLLCSYCHRIEHSDYDNVGLIEVAKEYYKC